MGRTPTKLSGIRAPHIRFQTWISDHARQIRHSDLLTCRCHSFHFQYARASFRSWTGAFRNSLQGFLSTYFYGCRLRGKWALLASSSPTRPPGFSGTLTRFRNQWLKELTRSHSNVLGGNFALPGVPSVGASGAIFGMFAVGSSFDLKPFARLLKLAANRWNGLICSLTGDIFTDLSEE